jgi:translation initiation factor IF-1
MDEMFAGYLCSTQVGERFKFGEVDGWLHEVRSRNGTGHIMVIVYCEDGVRTDNGMKRKVRRLLLDPRDVVRVESPPMFDIAFRREYCANPHERS